MEGSQRTWKAESKEDTIERQRVYRARKKEEEKTQGLKGTPTMEQLFKKYKASENVADQQHNFAVLCMHSKFPRRLLQDQSREP